MEPKQLKNTKMKAIVPLLGNVFICQELDEKIDTINTNYFE